MLAKVTERPRALVVLERGDDLTWLSLRNVDTIHVLTVDQLNTYDVLLSDDVVFTKAAYDAFVAGPATGKSVKAVATSSEVEVDGRGRGCPKPKAKAAKKSTAKKAAEPVVEAEVAAPEAKYRRRRSAAVEDEPKPAKKAAAKKATAEEGHGEEGQRRRRPADKKARPRRQPPTKAAAEADADEAPSTRLRLRRRPRSDEHLQGPPRRAASPPW